MHCFWLQVILNEERGWCCLLPPLLPKMPVGLRAFNLKWGKSKQNDWKAKNKQNPKQTKHLVSSWLSCLSIPSTKFSLICLAGENPSMAEGRNPLSVIPEKGSMFVPDRTDRFPPGACVPDSASLQCLLGHFFQPWSAARADAGSAALFGFHRKVPPPGGALWERMLWVEIVSFNLSRLHCVLSLVCYFLKWAFTSVVSRIILTWPFHGNHLHRNLLWASAFSCSVVLLLRHPSSQMKKLRRFFWGDWYAP